MNHLHKSFVSIFAKIYTNNFSEEMIDKYATGKEIYNFLLNDAKCCLPLRGDCNLWYLRCNEKFWQHHLQKQGLELEFRRIVIRQCGTVYQCSFNQDGLFHGKAIQWLLKKNRGRESNWDMYKSLIISPEDKPKSKTNTINRKRK
jgi:hypothetical protein